MASLLLQPAKHHCLGHLKRKAEAVTVSVGVRAAIVGWSSCKVSALQTGLTPSSEHPKASAVAAALLWAHAVVLPCYGSFPPMLPIAMSPFGKQRDGH